MSTASDGVTAEDAGSLAVASPVLPCSDDLVLRHAVAAFFAASAHEARGECDEAVVSYKQAFMLERALDADESDWPTWLSDAVAARQCAPDAPLAPLETARHTGLAPAAAVDPFAVSASLRRESYACVDGLVSAELAGAVAREIAAAHSAGLLARGEVGGNGIARVAAQRRGDWVVHVDSVDAGWPALHSATAALEELVAEMRADLGLGSSPSRPMCSIYTEGARYAMHHDNSCAQTAPAGELAEPCPNERALTCVLYANSSWQPGDGGELRIFRTNRTGSPDERHALVRAEIAPVAGRLLLFWSDYRCPHEVLCSWRERFAVTLWYPRSQPLSSAHV
ncbi:2OG-Fe(II) oxygenase superfamily-domain-containing protein [Pavlovales sp. CCMP2436]|nr:2OG-Fe(II) oxygenase superfamily-domain-containing protein [Pavlovales sp. CCMP2436]|mmetsp:Transcript_29619/g.74512  ORF Transcript_29619/g.74512 Transcript_29619/m.74512 type:complete len:338 (+) Transcript_29619:37-1050(+)